LLPHLLKLLHGLLLLLLVGPLGVGFGANGQLQDRDNHCDQAH